jgi:hypothetical protein
MEDYKVITPEGKEISVDEYMKTDHYRGKLKQRTNDFLTDKKEMELLELIKQKKAHNKKNYG